MSDGLIMMNPVESAVMYEGARPKLERRDAVSTLIQGDNKHNTNSIISAEGSNLANLCFNAGHPTGP